MREMKDSGVDWIGDIPMQWNVNRNKNAFMYKKRLVGENSSLTQLLSLTTKGIKQKDINNPEGKLPESFDTYQIVKQDDLVMCLFDLDVSAVFSGISRYEGMISPAYRVLTCNNTMYPRYADYWFKYIGYERKFNHYAKNIRFTLNIDEFQSLPMLFPPMDEQRIISDYLDEKCSKIDSIIEKQQKIIEKLKEYKLSIINEEVTRNIELNKAKLGKVILKIEQGWSPSPEEITSENEWKVLTLAAIKEGLFRKEEVKYFSGNIKKCKSIELRKGDFLLTRSNTRNLVGQVCVVNDVETNTIFSDLIYRLTFNGKYIDKNYAVMIFQSDYLRKQIERDAHGSSSTMVKITHKDIKSWDIELPDVDNQKTICIKLNKKISQINEVISKREQIINRLSEYKKSLIYEVVTGKKEVSAL